MKNLNFKCIVLFLSYQKLLYIQEKRLITLKGHYTVSLPTMYNLCHSPQSSVIPIGITCCKFFEDSKKTVIILSCLLGIRQKGCIIIL